MSAIDRGGENRRDRPSAGILHRTARGRRGRPVSEDQVDREARKAINRLRAHHQGERQEAQQLPALRVIAPPRTRRGGGLFRSPRRVSRRSVYESDGDAHRHAARRVALRHSMTLIRPTMRLALLFLLALGGCKIVSDKELAAKTRSPKARSTRPPISRKSGRRQPLRISSPEP